MPQSSGVCVAAPTGQLRKCTIAVEMCGFLVLLAYRYDDIAPYLVPPLVDGRMDG